MVTTSGRQIFLRDGMVLFLLLFCFVMTAYAQGTNIGKITHLVPGATVARNGKTEALQVNAPLQATDVISTDATGRVRIMFNDDSTLSFGSNVHINLRDFAAAGKKSIFNAQLLRKAAGATSTKIAAVPRGPGGSKGYPDITAGARVDEKSPVLVTVKGTIDADFAYEFEFRVNLTNGAISFGELKDRGSGKNRTYSLDFSEGSGQAKQSGWKLNFTDGSVQENTPEGVVTHTNWTVSITGSDSLNALKNMSNANSVHVTSFRLQDGKDIPPLEYNSPPATDNPLPPTASPLPRRGWH